MKRILGLDFNVKTQIGESFKRKKKATCAALIEFSLRNNPCCDFFIKKKKSQHPLKLIKTLNEK